MDTWEAKYAALSSTLDEQRKELWALRIQACGWDGYDPYVLHVLNIYTDRNPYKQDYYTARRKVGAAIDALNTFLAETHTKQH